MHAMVGNLWVPAWAVRPGAYAAVAPLADAMPLWIAMHSRTDDEWCPCYANRETLGATLACSRAKVGRQLARLQKAGLLFVVERDVDRTSQQHRPPARWALDPHAADLWSEKVEEGEPSLGIEAALVRIAEEDGQDGRWLHRALTALDAFERRSRLLGARIAEDMPIPPKQRRPKKRKSAKEGPGSKMSRGSKMSHEGSVIPGRGKERRNGRRPDPSQEVAVEGAPEADGAAVARRRIPETARNGKREKVSQGSGVQNEPRPDDPTALLAAEEAQR